MGENSSKIAIASSKRSRHDLSAPHITTTDFGRIDVVYHAQMVPGDDFNASLHSILKLAPLPQPTMGKCFLNVRAFFVPNRIVCNKDSFDWDLWRNGLQNNSHPYTDELVLTRRYTGGPGGYVVVSESHKKDYRRLLSQLGFPERVYNRVDASGDYIAFDQQNEYNEKYNLWAPCAYNRIWWDWYRDSNLIDDSQRSLYVDFVGAGHNQIAHFEPRYACYPKDYFTTCKKYPQSGSAVVSIGTRSGTTPAASVIAPYDSKNALNADGTTMIPTGNSSNVQWLRAANSLQKYLERNNIAGGRIMARYYARFGATPDSVRLDQSEYIGGFTAPIKIGDVTSPISTDIAGGSFDNAFIAPVGSMAAEQSGKGFVDGGAKLSYHAKEDGVFMILSSVVPEVYYYQGIPFDLLRGVDNDRNSYFTPEFENLGYEPILKKQVCQNRADLDGTAGTTDNEIFGFQPRYSSYKFKQGTISGDMVLKETQAGMQGFNLFRNLKDSGGNSGADLLPGFTMILPEDRLSFDRIFTIPGDHAGDYDHMWGMHYIENHADRPMSGEAMPSLEEDSHTAGKKVFIDNGGVRM